MWFGSRPGQLLSFHNRFPPRAIAVSHFHNYNTYFSFLLSKQCSVWVLFMLYFLHLSNFTTIGYAQSGYSFFTSDARTCCWKWLVTLRYMKQFFRLDFFKIICYTKTKSRLTDSLPMFLPLPSTFWILLPRAAHISVLVCFTKSNWTVTNSS